MTKFCELLNKTIKEKNLKKSEIAYDFGWTPMYFGRYCNGQLLPSSANIKKFADLMDISVQELKKIIEDDNSNKKRGLQQ